MDAFLELFSFEGRANRAWFFWHSVLDDFVIFTSMVALVVLGIATGPILALPMVGVLIGAAWAATAIAVKRLHDLGRPGWHILGTMIPIYNLYLGFVMLFKKGQIGPNEYGPDPLEAPQHSGSLYP